MHPICCDQLACHPHLRFYFSDSNINCLWIYVNFISHLSTIWLSEFLNLMLVYSYRTRASFLVMERLFEIYRIYTPAKVQDREISDILISDTWGCRRFPCLALFAGVWFYFSLLSAVFSFVFVCKQRMNIRNLTKHSFYM